MHSIFLILLFISITYCKDIKPVSVLETSGLVSDFVKDGDFIYVATDAGVVDIIDIYKRKITSQIRFEPLKTAMGDMVPVRIHSIDRYQGKTLLVTSDISAWRNVWIADSKGLTKIIDASKHLMPKRAFFNHEGKIILGTFGSDITLYDSNENYIQYNTHISESTIGGMVLSKDKKKIFVADESGM